MNKALKKLIDDLPEEYRPILRRLAQNRQLEDDYDVDKIGELLEILAKLPEPATSKR